MTKKILILEDEKIIGKLYQKKLEKTGFEVLWLETIQETKDEFFKFKPDIVLLDHSIKGEEKSGMVLVSKIRKALPQAMIIMLSNYSDFHLKEKALKKGADEYLVKINNPPAVLAELLKKKFL